MYYGNKKTKITERINDKQFRVTHSKGKYGIMDYTEIIRQLTYINEEASGRWVIEDIVDHK